MTGSERNGSERNCTKMKRALERNQHAGKCREGKGTKRNGWKLWEAKRKLKRNEGDVQATDVKWEARLKY